MLQSYIVTCLLSTACYGGCRKLREPVLKIGPNRRAEFGSAAEMPYLCTVLQKQPGKAPRPRHPSSGKAPPKLLKADTEASESRHEAADEPMTATEAADEAMTRRDGATGRRFRRGQERTKQLIINYSKKTLQDYGSKQSPIQGSPAREQEPQP